MEEEQKEINPSESEGLPIISAETKKEFFEQLDKYMEVEPNKVAQLIMIRDVLDDVEETSGLENNYSNYVKIEQEMLRFVYGKIFKNTPEEFTSTLDRIAYEDLRIETDDKYRPLNKQAHEAYIIGAGIVFYMFSSQYDLDFDKIKNDSTIIEDAFSNKLDASIPHEQQQLLVTLAMFRPMWGMFGDDIQTGGKSMYKVLTKLFPILHRP